MKETFVTILFSLFIIPSSFASGVEGKTHTPSFSAFVETVMQEKFIPGMAIAKIKNGHIELAQGYGFANIENKTPVTKNTLFNIASISKPIMGVVILQLIDQGKITLDQDINDYLPFKIDNPNLVGEVITLRHLASHTSSLDDFYDVETHALNKDAETSLGDHLKSLLLSSGTRYENGAYYLNTIPGKARKYSNLGAGVAGYLVEVVTGKTLAEYSKVLFTSLGMAETSWLLHDLDLAKVAIPYEVKQKKLVAHPHYGNPQYPDGGIRTNISELSKFLVAMVENLDQSGNKVLSDKQRKEMLSLQLSPEISTSQRFFWRDNSTGMIGHMGSDIGVFTAFYFDPIRKDGFIILMNRGQDEQTTQAMIEIANRLRDNP